MNLPTPLRILLDLLLPSRCVGCLAPLGLGRAPVKEGPSDRDPSATLSALFCESCLPSVLLAPAALPVTPLASQRSVLLYGGQVAQAIRRLKYQRQSFVAPPLGSLLALARPLPATQVDAVVPVPLHPRRLRRRRFNQAALLSRPLCRQLRLALRPLWLHRTRDTPPQALQHPHRRWDNVRGAFEASPRVAGQSLLLLDDVLTTGATVRACAEALLDAGAAAVHVLTLARAVR